MSDHIAAARLKPGQMRRVGPCSKKVWHETEEEATAQISKVTALYTREGRLHGTLSAYHCPHCGGWHLTSVEPHTFAKRSRSQVLDAAAVDKAVSILRRRWADR